MLAGRVEGPRADDPGRLGGRRRARPRAHAARAARRDRARGVPGRRLLRRQLHRQHDGDRGRHARPRDRRRRPDPGRACRGEGRRRAARRRAGRHARRGAARPPGASSTAARSRTRWPARSRRRLDQRLPAPAGDRARGRRLAHARRARRHQREHARARRPRAGRALRGLGPLGRGRDRDADPRAGPARPRRRTAPTVDGPHARRGDGRRARARTAR